MEELLEACEDFPEVAVTLTGEKTYYVVGDEVPELVAYDAGTVFTEAKARSLEEIFAEGQVIFQATQTADTEPSDAFQNAVQDRLDHKAIAQFVAKTISLKSCHRGQLRPVDLSI